MSIEGMIASKKIPRTIKYDGKVYELREFILKGTLFHVTYSWGNEHTGSTVEKWYNFGGKRVAQSVSSWRLI